MNVSLKKVLALWRQFSSTLGDKVDDDWSVRAALLRIGAAEADCDYAQDLFKAVTTILDYKKDGFRELVGAKLPDGKFTARDRNCPCGVNPAKNEFGARTVYERLLENSKDFGHDDIRKECRDIVWNKLSTIQWRVDRFRVSSNAGGNSKWETLTTNVIQNNPDSWFYSYNFPWHIMSWMQDVSNGRKPDYKFAYEWDHEEALDYRYVYKYVWMLSNPRVLPILSLRSFVNLIPFFSKVFDGDFEGEFGISTEGRGSWSQDFADFTSPGKWPALSAAIIKNILGKENDDGSVDLGLRKRLAIFLFVVSLMDGGKQDLDTLVEKGNKAVVLYGPPGTGKTFTALEYVFAKLGMDREKENDYVVEEKDEKGRSIRVYFDSEKGGRENSRIKGEVTVVQFHPNYSYQDFVGGIFPCVDQQKGGELSYETRKGVFKLICEQAEKAKQVADAENANKKNGEPKVEPKRFYLIIDEINRADLSSVFGELMYGLEYRDRVMQIPIFGNFKIPDNVYIIGTMNNTDKSLVGFDIALRRRFAFLRVGPDMSVLARTAFVSEKILDEGEGDVDVAEQFAQRARKLNDALKDANGDFRLPAEKQIGHAYFLKVKEFCEAVEEDEVTTSDETPNDDAANDSKKKLAKNRFYVLTPYALEQLWLYHIEPLLEEYIGLEYETKGEAIKALRDEFCREFEAGES